MEGRLRETLDKIHAEESLKEKTADFLYDEIQKQGGYEKQTRQSSRTRNARTRNTRMRNTRTRNARMRFAAVCASFAVLLLAGGFSYNLYFTPSAYVDMDVNPSIELILNRFGRVLDAFPYNDDGAAILQSIDVKNKTYGRSVQILLDEMILQGILTPDGLVSVTVQTKNDAAEQKMVNELRASIDTLLASHHSAASTDVFAVSREVRECAHDYNLSPAKYLSIEQLKEVDPAATFEGCSDHSISEIRELTQEHGEHHREESGAQEHHREESDAQVESGAQKESDAQVESGAQKESGAQVESGSGGDHGPARSTSHGSGRKRHGKGRHE